MPVRGGEFGLPGRDPRSHEVSQSPSKWPGFGGFRPDSAGLSVLSPAVVPDEIPFETRAQLGRAIDDAVELAGLQKKDAATRASMSVDSLARYRKGERWPDKLSMLRIDEAVSAGGELVALQEKLETEHYAALAALESLEPPAPPDETVIGAGPRKPSSTKLSRGLRSRAVKAVIGATALAAIAVSVLALANSSSPSQGPSVAGDALTQHRFLRAYVGKVWIKITDVGDVSGRVNLLLHWGGKRAQLQLELGRSPTYLTTGKTHHDSIPLLVWAAEGTRVAFGERLPPTGTRQVSISAYCVSHAQ